jgi:hypothetical protein
MPTKISASNPPAVLRGPMRDRCVSDLKETEHESFRLPTNKDIPIWRYVDLAKYLSMLSGRGLFFARATSLGDPFEGSTPRMLVLSREYIRANRATDPALAQW